MGDIVNLIEEMRQRGDYLMIDTSAEGYGVSVCRDEWDTDDIYALRSLPTAQGETLLEAIESLPPKDEWE